MIVEERTFRDLERGLTLIVHLSGLPTAAEDTVPFQEAQFMAPITLGVNGGPGPTVLIKWAGTVYHREYEWRRNVPQFFTDFDGWIKSDDFKKKVDAEIAKLRERAAEHAAAQKAKLVVPGDAAVRFGRGGSAGRINGH